jgi:hypothetical protein
MHAPWQEVDPEGSRIPLEPGHRVIRLAEHPSGLSVHYIDRGDGTWWVSGWRDGELQIRWLFDDPAEATDLFEKLGY